MTPRNKPPILVVDDEPEILFSLEALLRRDFDVYTAEGGAQALEVLRSHPVHVVMTDQRMPEMTGVELLSRVRGQWPEAVRIVFTGYADIKAVITAVNEGRIARYLAKPWDPDELLALLHQACAEYDHLAERLHLLADLRDHVRRGQALAAALGSTPNVAEEAGRFGEAGTTLLARLDRTLAEAASG